MVKLSTLIKALFSLLPLSQLALTAPMPWSATSVVKIFSFVHCQEVVDCFSLVNAQ